MVALWKERLMGMETSLKLRPSASGPDIKVWDANILLNEEIPEYKMRTAQTFGKGTTEKLSSLSIGVVGVSGTGIPVVEQLHRLSVGE
jgi:hypothetical protein